MRGRYGLALVVVIASACRGGSAGVTGTSVTTMATAYAPSYRDTPCDSAVPADPRVNCGILTVPVDRSEPAGPQVELPVAIVRSAAARRMADPIVYLSGGPGFAGRDLAHYFLTHDVAGPRDVILFDQRGTGAATPSLDCPEVASVAVAALTAADPPEVEGRQAQAALQTCRRRLLEQGVDLDQFDTPTTALDVRDLRAALGIGRWNLFGRSYGTTVALELLRADGAAVRSVVLDSVYPPDVANDARSVEEHADRVFAQLFAGCEEDRTCHERYPTFEADFGALVDEWNADPFETTLDGPDGRPETLVLTGDDVVAGVWNGMYDGAVTAALPSLVQPLRERGPAANAIVAELAGRAVDDVANVAEGVAVVVDCADRERLDRHDESGVLARHPEYGSLVSLGFDTDLCAAWDVSPVDASFNDPVRSSVPALVFGDRYDPRTPPEDGERAASTLARSTFVETVGFGHAASLAQWCLTSTLVDFFIDPDAKVEDSCAGERGGPRWS
jgi:pimeloyl-ACP methyl ester carboxylesterase